MKNEVISFSWEFQIQKSSKFLKLQSMPFQNKENFLMPYLQFSSSNKHIENAAISF